MRPVAHQLQQRGHPGLERVRRQANEALAVGLRQVDKRRQRGLAGNRVGRAGRCGGNQLGQPRQDVVALAVDLHAQRQLEPRRRGFVGVAILAVALRLHLHAQAVCMGDPAGQRVFQRQHKAGLAQHPIVVLSPVQPVLLRRVAGNAEQAAAVGLQAHVHQAGDGVQLGLGVALQQHLPFGAIDQHAGALAGPPANVALVVKAQAGLHQPQERHVLRRVQAQVQAGGGRHVT